MAVKAKRAGLTDLDRCSQGSTTLITFKPLSQVQAEEGQVCKEQDPGQGPQLEEEDSEEGWQTLNYLTLFNEDLFNTKATRLRLTLLNFQSSEING